MKKHIKELLDVNRLQTLMERFTDATGTGTAIIDLEGNTLVATGWQDICTKFHRVHPETCKNCIESDTVLANDLGKGKKYNVYKCLNGLVDVAVPIIIGEEHLGNLFIGQFLSAAPSRKFFLKQAKKYGFDEKEYMKALEKVPILTDDDVKKKMAFLSELALLIGDMGIKAFCLSELTENLEKRIEERTKEVKDAQIATLNMMQDAEEARQEAEKANSLLKQQQGQLKSMFDGIEDVIYVADPDTYELLYFNQAARNIWGEDYKGKTCYKVLQGRDEPCPFCTNNKILQEPGKAVIWEFQNEINKHWYRCFDKAIKWTSDKYVRFEMSIDITEIKDAQQAILKEKEITESILNSVPGVFYQISTEGNFVRTNKNFQDLLGKTAEQMLTTNALDLFEGDDKQLIGSAMQEVFKSGSSEAEAYMITQKGKIPFYFTGILQEIDEKPCLLGVGNDISKIKDAEIKLKQINAELKESNEQLERFAYVASHDLQEPLRKIKSFSELLVRRIEDQLDEKSQKYVSYVTSGAVRMQQLINDLLQFSRISTRGKPFELIEIDSVLQRAMESLALVIQQTGAQIEIAEMPHIKADASQLNMLFQNLLANALKFCGKKVPQIRISYQDKPGFWQFSVADNGIGIDEEYKDRIFVIFQRLHGKQEYEGTGIGLALCKKIVERHRGEIWFESKKSEGTTFYFTISKKF